jgi:CheY-like chemotaxis protein
MLYDELVSLCSVATQTPLFDPSKIDLSQKRVLIVEDNDINLEVATYLLKETHAKVEIARNGLEAVEMIQEHEHPFDLILMDVQMPIMDGYEATRIIRKELNVLTPIVAMTANVMVQDVEKCIQAGMDAHIGKPFEVEDFYGTLLEALHVSLTLSPKQQSNTHKRVKQHFAKKDAIKKLGGNEALWQKLFVSFFATYLELPSKLNALIKNNEIAMLIDYVHTTKGLCGTIGVLMLEQHLSALEQFLKEKNTLEGIALDAIFEEHRSLISTLHSEYDKIDLSNSTLGIQQVHEDKQVVAEIFKELKLALDTSNVSKVNLLLDQLATHETVREHEAFKALLLACKSFDFDAAMMSLTHLSEEI